MSDWKSFSIFSYFEKIIDPFKDSSEETPPGKLTKFYFHYLRQIWLVLFILLIVGLLVALVEVALFKYIAKIIDMAQTTNPKDIFNNNLKQLIIMASVIVIARPLLFGLHNLITHQTITANLSAMIRWQNHRYILKQSVNFFHNDLAGRVANRVIQTGGALRDSALQMIEAIWHILIYAGSAMFLFLQADWHLILPLTLWMIIYLIMLFHYIPKIRSLAISSSEARSKLMGLIVDCYTNIITIKLFYNSNKEEGYGKEAIEMQMHKHQSVLRLITEIDTLLTFINGMLIASTTGLSLWLWSNGVISIGSITLATGLVIRINNMSSWIIWVVNSIFENLGIVQDGIETISKSVEIKNKESAKLLNVTSGSIKFESVGFKYNKNSNEVISNFNLIVRPKEKIGIVGPSGAGKSTIMSLLLRLYDLDSGKIYIDGQDISSVTQESLRAKIGVVTQDISLLNRSIRENLTCGDDTVSQKHLKEVLYKSKMNEFLVNVLDHKGLVGLEATVGERGVKLSGGQKQRVAIARVLLKNAPILLLDEATSALDSEIESIIQENLEGIMHGKTVITIAHRLSTIIRMDRLIVIENGKIIETGTHKELILRNGLYKTLWDHQTGGFIK